MSIRRLKSFLSIVSETNSLPIGSNRNCCKPWPVYLETSSFDNKPYRLGQIGIVVNNPVVAEIMTIRVSPTDWVKSELNTKRKKPLSIC